MKTDIIFILFISEITYASKICLIFKRLNLNFLKLPQDTTFTPPLREDEINVYKPDVLMKYSKELKEKYFVSILQQYVVPPKTKRQSQDKYDKSKFSFIASLNLGLFLCKCL